MKPSDLEPGDWIKYKKDFTIYVIDDVFTDELITIRGHSLFIGKPAQFFFTSDEHYHESFETIKLVE